MLRFSAFVLTALCVAGPVSAASWADGLFQEVSKDFGPVPRGPELRHSFPVKNTTGDVVRIANVRVSCGCVTATPSRHVLQPGEEGSIDITMDTTRFTGLKSVTVYVLLDSPRGQEVRLWVRANGRDDVALNPQALAFGTIKRGSNPSTAITLTLLGSGQYEVIDARCESNYLKIAFKEHSRTATEASFQISATLRPDAPVGRWYTDVWVKTNHPTLERIRVPLTVEIESPLSISPGVLSLGEVKLGAEIERRVIVRGVKPFKITQVQGTDEFLSVRDSAIDRQAVHVLTIRYKATRVGDFDRGLKVLTDLEANGDIDFRATAQVQP